MGDSNDAGQSNNYAKHSHSNSDMPVVSISELLKENADVFAPMEGFSEMLDVPSEKPLPEIGSMADDSDDEIQIVESVNPLASVDHLSNLLKADVADEPIDTEMCNESIDISELLPMVCLTEKFKKIRSIEKQELETGDNETKPAVDVVILSDDDEDLDTTNHNQPRDLQGDVETNVDADSIVANNVKTETGAVSNLRYNNNTLSADINIGELEESRVRTKVEAMEVEVSKDTTVAESSNSAGNIEDDDIIMLEDESTSKNSADAKEIIATEKNDETLNNATNNPATAALQVQNVCVEANSNVKMESDELPVTTAEGDGTIADISIQGVDDVAAEEEVATANSDDGIKTSNADGTSFDFSTDDIGEVTCTFEEAHGSSKQARECINFECPKLDAKYFEAPQFIQSHYHANKKYKVLYVCENCFDMAIQRYEDLSGALLKQQPLLLVDIPRPPDLVEILDSSDEESNSKSSARHTKGDFEHETLQLIADDLSSILSETLTKINIDQQLKWNCQILDHRFNVQQEEAKDLQNELRNLQRIADRMHNALYKSTNLFIEELPSWDSTTGREVQLANATYPPHGQYHPPKIDQYSLFYAVRQKMLSPWVPCKVIEIPSADELTKTGDKPMYKVKFLRPVKNELIKSVPATNLAYGVAPNVRLGVGVRVIALFNMMAMLPRSSKEDMPRHHFYPGIIAEPLQQYNGWRYLIFFDDGYAQYVQYENVRVVCESSKNVWESVHHSSSEFIQNYLKQFGTSRPMVQVRKNQRMTTESNGQWLYARVNDVDGSLVQMVFEENKRFEWIYRGSTRLGPLFREKQTQRNASTTTTKRNEPFIEYIGVNDDSSIIRSDRDTTKPPELSQPQRTFPAQAVRDTPQQQEQKRAVARKSTTVPQRPTVQHLNNSTIYVDEDNRPKGKVVYYTAKKHLPPKKFVVHDCDPTCLYEVTYNLSSYSLLSKPLLSGWERQICKSKAKKAVIYRAPCGRRLRDMSELHQYLRKTKCSLNVENFDFDYAIHCLAEYVTDACIVQKNDISEGTENMVVPCVNHYDKTMPPPCKYSAKRIPTQDVNLNLEPEFLCGCDCEDDCLDKTKCQCWQLTIAGARFCNIPPEEIGYVFKRLPEPVTTGIYECNSRCRCNKTCLNRVAQHSLQMKLQVFKTGNRGWGLRCLNDVPKGSFICCYAGHLLTEQHANEAGNNLGDEYFAELDYIEVVENVKEGYEPDVFQDDDCDDDDEYDPESEIQHREEDSDDEFSPRMPIDINVQTRYRTRHSKQEEEKPIISANSNSATASTSEVANGDDGSEEDDNERQIISFMPHSSSSVNFERENDNEKHKSIRKFYGKNESVYIMDAKKSGNIGRYFNHSCSPNLFVQNVFVDTHDLRFPWVAFFAASHIRAGTELTWNYNYDVGSVPGKVLYCQCGSDNCRGRLL